jgi:hypothetical protein
MKLIAKLIYSLMRRLTFMDVNSRQADAMLAEYAALKALDECAPSATSEERRAKIRAWAEAHERRRVLG